MIRRLLMLVRDLFDFPAEPGEPIGRIHSLERLLDQSSHPRPLSDNRIVIAQRSIYGYTRGEEK
jgi:hypothetical protein